MGAPASDKSVTVSRSSSTCKAPRSAWRLRVGAGRVGDRRDRHDHHGRRPGRPGPRVDHLPGLAVDVRPDDRLLVDDGPVGLQVIAVDGPDVRVLVTEVVR